MELFINISEVVAFLFLFLSIVGVVTAIGTVIALYSQEIWAFVITVISLCLAAWFGYITFHIVFAWVIPYIPTILAYIVAGYFAFASAVLTVSVGVWLSTIE